MLGEEKGGEKGEVERERKREKREERREKEEKKEKKEKREENARPEKRSDVLGDKECWGEIEFSAGTKRYCIRFSPSLHK